MSRRNAPENFFFRGTGLPTAVRKNQPLVPRSNLGGTVCARTNPWFRGQTLLVLGHGGGGYIRIILCYVILCCNRARDPFAASQWPDSGLTAS